MGFLPIVWLPDDKFIQEPRESHDVSCALSKEEAGCQLCLSVHAERLHARQSKEEQAKKH